MQEWTKTTNIYEVNLRQYTPEGTINAFAKHLPRLKDMGVETLWFIPITPIAQKNKKGSLGSYYACKDYTSVAEEFGTLQDFKVLVNEAHQMNFKVIIDWVANHTGWDHWWTIEHPDWYEKNESTGDFKKASEMDDIIELDFTNQPMRTAMIDAMKFWINETGIDGFRCDLAFWVELDFWQQAKPELEKIKPLFWLGELDPLEHPEYMNVFNAAYTWRWMHKTEDFCKGQASFEELIQIAKQYGNAPGMEAWFTSNHDENSWNGTEYEKYGALAKTLAVFSGTWPGVPLIYSGQELPNHKRLQFFEKDMIEWNDAPQLHDFYKTLLQAKKNYPALATDALLEIMLADMNNKIFVFKRKNQHNEIVVALNFSDDEKQFYLSSAQGHWVDIFSNEKIEFSNESIISLTPWAFLVWVNHAALL